MSNRNQLRVLTDDQAAAITAAGNGLAYAEVVKIFWPSPDGTKVYAFWQLLDDDLYSASAFEDFLDGAPLIVGFVADDEKRVERFHEIPLSSQIGDDVVRMKFVNRGRAFEKLALTHKGGVQVRIYRYYPQIDGGVAKEVFQGHLRTPDAVNKDFVEISVAAGLLSADLLVPSSPHGTVCRFAARFGGRFDPILPNNPCDYDFHVGGSRGVGDPDNGDEPFTFCDGAKADCMARLGDLLSYGGFDAIADTSNIGAGQHTTGSETQGQTTHLKNPVQVCYGEGTANNLPLLDYAKEYNPSPKHQDAGTIRALFEVSEGPIEEITEVEMMDRPLPRTLTGVVFRDFILALLGNTDGRGLEVRLGTQQQEPTTYSENVLNYNRLAHFRGDVNPINPVGVAPSSIIAKCKYKGRNTIKVYSDEDSFSYAYSNLRAWVLVDLLTDTTYGHREDIARHSIADFLHLAELGSTFNGLAQGKSAHQQFQDICLAGLQFPPFAHDGITRWLAIEEYDLDAGDIPTFTDLGSSRNILVDQNGVSRLTVTQKDDDRIPNVYTLTFNDKDHKNLERPLLFPDPEQQELAGQVYGDKSLREVPDQETAFGTNNITEARQVGFYLLDYGRFYSGGTRNNCEVNFACPGFLPDVIDLHPNKVIKVVSVKLDNAKDRDGNVFQYFIVRRLVHTPRGETIVTAQAYANLRTVITLLPISFCDDTPPSDTLGSTDYSVSGDVVQFRSNPDDPFSFPNTVAFWVIVDGDTTGDPQIFTTRGILENEWAVGISNFFAGHQLYFRGNGGIYDYGSTLNYSQWYHVAIISEAGDGAARKIYLDGVLDIDTTGDGPVANSYWSYDILFGGRGNFAFRYLEGSLCASKAWTAILTAEEIQAEMESYGPCKQDDLWAWWPQKDQAEISKDFSPNCRHLGNDNEPPVDTDYPPGITLYCAETEPTDTHTGGGGEIQTVADSSFVLIDRLWREVEIASGLPGVYVAAGPQIRTKPWPEFELYRDKGAGYAKLFENSVEAPIGEAISVLAGTELGSETVDVELLPGQVLASYSGGEVSAGAGLVFLGGEIFQYRTATQLDDSPNQWRLSNLSNRGAKCTSAFKATHATGDKFAALDETAVLFLSLEASEIGQTRDFKGFTAGQDIDDIDITATSFQFTAPNFQIETPSDYTLTLDQSRREVRHTWTSITDACLVLTDLIYEIYEDIVGAPGALLWAGTPNQWREPVDLEGTYTYHFRVRTRFDVGDFITAAITVDYANDLNAPWILPTQIFDDNNVTRAVPGYDRLGVEVYE